MTQYSILVMLELFGSREVKWEKSSYVAVAHLHTDFGRGCSMLKKGKTTLEINFLKPITLLNLLTYRNEDLFLGTFLLQSFRLGRGQSPLSSLNTPRLQRCQKYLNINILNPLPKCLETVDSYQLTMLLYAEEERIAVSKV